MNWSQAVFVCKLVHTVYRPYCRFWIPWHARDWFVLSVQCKYSYTLTLDAEYTLHSLTWSHTQIHTHTGYYVLRLRRNYRLGVWFWTESVRLMIICHFGGVCSLLQSLTEKLHSAPSGGVSNSKLCVFSGVIGSLSLSSAQHSTYRRQGLLFRKHARERGRVLGHCILTNVNVYM